MPAFNILVINKLAERHIAAIKSAAPDSTVLAAEPADAGRYIGNANIVATWGAADFRPLFTQAPELRWVHALSAGVEKLLFPEMLNSSVKLTNSRGIHGIPMSEHVLSLVLAFTRGLHVLFKQQQQQIWQRTPLEEVYEKTIGIVGLGNIGREVAKRAKALGMRVLAAKREQTAELFVDELYRPDQLTELLKTADFIVVAVPLTAQTRHLFTTALFRQMKPSAYFINVSRGAVVNEADLAAALREGTIKGAALDVFEQEPLPQSSPLWTMPNVIITPHIAAISPYYLDRAIKLFCQNLTSFAAGEDMVNLIDKQKGY